MINHFMKNFFLIKNATIVNENRTFTGSVLIENQIIKKIFASEKLPLLPNKINIIDATGLILIAGVIDSHVHFRTPGLEEKGDFASESRAAIAGGITSFLDMPNTKPKTTTIDLLEQKSEIAAQMSLANYGFFIGATNNNLQELKKLPNGNVCGVKIFMGGGEGDLLIDNEKTLSAIFAEISALIAVHSEDEQIIRQNIDFYKNKFRATEIPIEYHPLIRSAEACYRSSERVAALATKYGARLHILHLSTEKELQFFDSKPLIDKKITAETCVHYLWFSDKDYKYFGAKIKCNPAIKTESDRLSLINALNINKLDIISTDHAPHLLYDKRGGCLTAKSGIPSVQHSLVAMLELVKNGYLTMEKVVEKMCHAPAELYKIEKRGYIRENYFADLVLINPNEKWTDSRDNILYKCGWSPFENTEFSNKVVTVFVNGKKVFDNGTFDETHKGERLKFSA